MIELEITTNALDALTANRKAGAAIGVELRKEIRDLQRLVKQSLSDAMPKRSGRLARSVRTQLIVAGVSGRSGVRGEVWSSDAEETRIEGAGRTRYAGILRRGGVISATRRQLLTVPVGTIKNPRAFMRNPEEFGYVRAVITPRSILGVRADRSTERIFARVASVRIPGLDYAERAARSLEGPALGAGERAVDRALAPLNGGA